jgi:gluconolactonase
MESMPEKIAGGFGATAGPVFSRRGYLLFCDVKANRILKWERGKVTTLRENSNGARALTFDHQGRLLACEAHSVTCTEKDGRITTLALGIGAFSNFAPTDLVYAIDGTTYIAQPESGEVLRATKIGELLKGVQEGTGVGGPGIPNRQGLYIPDVSKPVGVALAPNQQRLYVADAGRDAIRVYEIAADGALKNGKSVAGLREHPGGLKTDESGGIWVALPSGIQHLDAAGKVLEKIAIPEPPNNCNWGEGFHDLFVTAGASVYRVPVKANGTRTY